MSAWIVIESTSARSERRRVEWSDEMAVQKRPSWRRSALLRRKQSWRKVGQWKSESMILTVPSVCVVVMGARKSTFSW